MPSFSHDSFRHYEIAKRIHENFNDVTDAYICIIFSAIYIEGVVNEYIYRKGLANRLYKEIYGEEVNDKIDFDIYQDKISIGDKLTVIFDDCSMEDYRYDKEYIELKHLISLRNELVHIKPLEKDSEGRSIIKIAKKAMNYLHKNLKIIKDPYGVGQFWARTLWNKKVADWALQVAVNSIDYLYEATLVIERGTHTLDYHKSMIHR